VAPAIAFPRIVKPILLALDRFDFWTPLQRKCLGGQPDVADAKVAQTGYVGSCAVSSGDHLGKGVRLLNNDRGLTSPQPLSGVGEGSRKTIGEATTDLTEDTVGMPQNQVVGKAKDDKSGRGKPGIATPVTPGPWEVRRAIGFDDESGFPAEEIHDERSDRMLSAELGQHHLPAAHHLPKHLFRTRAVTSQSTRLERPWSEQTGHARLSALCPPGCLHGLSGSPLRPRRGAGGEVDSFRSRPRPVRCFLPTARCPTAFPALHSLSSSRTPRRPAPDGPQFPDKP